MKVKANIIRGCLTQGSLAMAAPLRGSRIRRPPLDIRELLKDTRLKLKFYKNTKKSDAFPEVFVEKGKVFRYSDVEIFTSKTFTRSLMVQLV